MICQSDESYETEKKNVEALLKSRVDGFIISVSKNTEDFEHFKQLEKRGRPLVFFNRVWPNSNASKVVVDDYTGAFKAVEHLILGGCKRIAHISGPHNLMICKDRLHGYLDALKKHGLSFDEKLIEECDFTFEQGKSATSKFLELKERPDGIFVVNDAVAFGCLQILKKNNIKIPKEIAVVGFTNEPLSDLIEPSLTTVSQPTYEIGSRAAQLLLDRINKGPENFKPQTVVLENELVVRNSTRPIKSST